MTPSNTFFVEHFTQAARAAEARGFPALSSLRRRLYLADHLRPLTAAEIRPLDNGFWPLHGLLLIAAETAGVTVKDVQGRTQGDDIMLARQIYCWLARKFSDQTLEEIGARINRDHTSALYSFRKMQKAGDGSPLDSTCPPTEWARYLLEFSLSKPASQTWNRSPVSGQFARRQNVNKTVECPP